MSAKKNSSGPGIKKIKIAKTQENWSVFNIDEHKSFPKFCKQNYEFNFQSKNLQIFDSLNKMGKSMVCVSKNIKKKLTY